MATMTTVNGHHRRAELAAFLRARRERITPEQAGLPPGSRRRTRACAARRSRNCPAWA